MKPLRHASNLTIAITLPVCRLAVVAAMALAILPASPAQAQCIVETIDAADGVGNVGFGIELSVGGDRFLVSSRFATTVEEDSGGVHIFRRAGRRVIFEETLIAPPGSGDDRFGWATAIEGRRIAVAAPTADEGRGAVYIYQWIADHWERQAHIVAPDGMPGDEFGRSIALRGNYLLVGAPLRDDIGPGTGAAYVYRRNGADWNLATVLYPDAGSEGSAFGWNMAVNGDRAAISAHLDNDAGLDAGAVYLFRHVGGEWLQSDKLTASDAAPSSWFGSSMSFEETQLLVGAKNHGGHGAAYLFENDGLAWTEVQQFVPTDADPGDAFGAKCALAGNRILITATNDLGTEHGVGATYLFTKHDDLWAEESKLTVPDAEGGNRFGGAIAITAKIGLIAGSFDDGRNGRLFVHHLERAECRCMAGKVNSGNGPIRDVLFVNGSAGGRDRTVLAAETDLLTAYVLEPPMRGNRKFVVHANIGFPDRSTIQIMPGNIGAACFPMLTSQGAAPIAIWNSIGRFNEIGQSQYFDGSEIPEPGRAPAILFQLSNGDPTNLPAGTVITFQGAMGDPGAAGDREGSITNAVVLEVQ